MSLVANGWLVRHVDVLWRNGWTDQLLFNTGNTTQRGTLGRNPHFGVTVPLATGFSTLRFATKHSKPDLVLDAEVDFL